MDPAVSNDQRPPEKQKAYPTDVKGDRPPVQGAQPTMATIYDDDERLLARIGYKQELRREFTKWSTVSYAISLLGVLGSQPATYGIPISLGGPATAVWAWFIGSVMAYIIASSGKPAGRPLIRKSGRQQSRRLDPSPCCRPTVALRQQDQRPENLSRLGDLTF